MGGHPGAYHHHGGYYGGYRGFYGYPGYPFAFGIGLGYGAGLGYGYGLAGYSYPIYGAGLGLPYNTGFYGSSSYGGGIGGPGIGGPGYGGPGMGIPGNGVPGGLTPGVPPLTPPPDQNNKDPNNKDLPVSTTSTAPTAAKLTVIVPDGGQVWFDNTLTPGAGNRWVYSSPQLEPGRTYTVAVKARWGEGDQAKSFDLPIKVQAGDDMTVDLTRTR